MPSIRAIAFDMDGLLLNTEELFDHVGTSIVRRRGCQLDYELIKRMMGQPGRVSLQLMIDHYEFDATVEELQRETDEIFADLLPTRLAPMAGAVELLRGLSASGMPMALTTSSRHAFVERTMSICDLRDHFQFWLTAESVTHGKPHPEIYHQAASRFQVAAEEMLVFEDSENGCRAAVAAGARVVAVPSKHSHLHDYTGAVLVAESLFDKRIRELVNLPCDPQSPGS